MIISDEILDELQRTAVVNRATLRGLLERYEELRDGRPEACPWGHPYVPENTYIHATSGARVCRHCTVCQQRGARMGVPLARYYELHPEAVEYRGFPVAGARKGRTSAY